MEAHARTHRHTHTPRAGMTLRLEAKFNKAPPESGSERDEDRGGEGGASITKWKKKTKRGRRHPRGDRGRQMQRGRHTCARTDARQVSEHRREAWEEETR